MATSGFEISLPAGDLSQRMNDRLLGSGSGRVVVWQGLAGSVLLHLETLRTRLLDGWLLVNLDLESDQTGQQTLQFVFCMGAANNGDDENATATINVANSNAAVLADGWGDAVRRVLWDAVLDGVEAAVAGAKQQAGSTSLMLTGFHTNAQALVVSVVGV